MSSEGATAATATTEPAVVMVTGGSGLVGAAIKSYIEESGMKLEHETWIFLSSKDGDLRKRDGKRTKEAYEAHVGTQALVPGQTERLSYALNGQEAIKICKDKSGNCKVDGKIRRDHRFPLGCMDVVSLPKTGENFRILYDIKGRFQPVRIDAKEAAFKLCKIKRKVLGKNKIPYIVTHDGRTIRYPHPDIKKNDSVKLNLETGEIDGVVKFENGATVYVTGGNSIGRVGALMHVEKHPGSYEIVHLRDSEGNSFATRLSNIFVIGQGKKPLIKLPKYNGIRMSLIAERNSKIRGGDDDDE